MRTITFYIVYALLLLLPAGRTMAQADTGNTVHFRDVQTNLPLKNVLLIQTTGIEIGVTDNNGSITIPQQMYYYPILASCPGYDIDTLSPGQKVVLLRPRLQVLQEVTISSNRPAPKVAKVLHSNLEYIVDYELAGSNVLLATYSGANGKDAKLILLNNDGDTVAYTRFPHQPLALYKSCIGKMYCVTADSFYAVLLGNKGLKTGLAYGIALLPLLKQCQVYTDSTFYYKITDRNTFQSRISMARAGDSIYKKIYEVEDKSAAAASYEQYVQVQALLAAYQFIEAARIANERALLDHSALKYVDIPLFRIKGEIVLFDLKNSLLRSFSTDGRPVKAVPLQLNADRSFAIVKDEYTDDVYLQNNAGKEMQTIQKIDMETGKTEGAPLPVARPFAERLKIYNGRLFYLWQNNQDHSTRQLFMQQ